MEVRAWPVLRPMVSSSTAGIPRRVAGQRPPVIRRAPLWSPLRIFHPMVAEGLRWGGGVDGDVDAGVCGGGVGMVGCSVRVCSGSFGLGRAWSGLVVLVRRVPAIPVWSRTREGPRYRLQPKLDARPGESVMRRSRVAPTSDTQDPCTIDALDHCSSGGMSAAARCSCLMSAAISHQQAQLVVARTRYASATDRHQPPHLAQEKEDGVSPRLTLIVELSPATSPLGAVGTGIRRLALSSRGGSLRGAIRALTAALVIGVFAASAAGLMPPSAASASNWAPVHSGDFPDPDILQYQGDYYAFATQSTPPKGGVQINIQVSFSTDGETWNNSGADALPDSDLGSWAEPGDTWAPSVAVYQAPSSHGVTPPPVFVMYYTATERSTGDQCIGMATASTPFGPYQDTESQPAVCDNDFDAPPTVDDGYDGGSIDPDIFTDPDGNSYLLWKSDGNHIGETSTQIWSAPLSQNLQSITLSGQASVLLSAQESWQSGIVEGPDMYDNQYRAVAPTPPTTTSSSMPAATKVRARTALAGPRAKVRRAPARTPPRAARTRC